MIADPDENIAIGIDRVGDPIDKIGDAMDRVRPLLAWWRYYTEKFLRFRLCVRVL